MSIRRVRAALAAIVSGSIAIAAPSNADLDLLQEVRRVAARLEIVLGASPRRVPLAVRAPAGERERVAAGRADALVPPARLAARGRAWADLGLGAAGAARDVVQRLCADIDGFTLDAEGNRILIEADRLTDADFEPGEAGDAAMDVLMTTGVRPDEPSLVHVLAHRLQEERGTPAPGDDTTDARLAASAWAEGEANLAALLYLFEGLGMGREVIALEPDPGEFLEGRLVPASVDEAPAATRRLLDFAYRDGFAASSAVWTGGGGKALSNAMLERRTTASVLHLDRPAARPAEVSASTGPEGTVLVDRDRLGEVGVIVWASVLTGKDDLGLQAGDGWEGDALDRWEAPGREAEGTTVWTTRWSSESDASDFAYAARRSLETRFGEAVREVEGGVVVDHMDRRHTLARAGREVVIRVSSLSSAVPGGEKRESQKTGPATELQ